MPKPILFISDLHLDASRPDITTLFYRFLDEVAPGAGALYILGDLFEVWIGDDDPSEFSKQIVSKLKQVTATALPVSLMFGNRDFLMTNRFETETGCSIIYEPLTIDLFGTKTMLLHGDTLCTDDVEYQNFRAQVRNPQWQQWFLSKSFEERAMMAKQARDASKSSTRSKSMEIMDVNPAAVLAAFATNCVTQMIHGHTHRPAVHTTACAQGECTRMVLGDWHQQGWYLEATEAGNRLLTWQ